MGEAAKQGARTRRMDQHDGTAFDRAKRVLGKLIYRLGGVDDPPLELKPAVLKLDMIASAKVERPLKTGLDNHRDDSRAMARASAHIREPSSACRVGRRVTYREAGEAEKRVQLITSVPSRVGARQQDGINIFERRRAPVHGPHQEDRGDDALEAELRGAFGRRVCARLRPKDQENDVPPEKRARKP